MPELPEVETVTAALRPHLLGRCLVRVVARTAKLRAPLDADRLRQLAGPEIVAVRRRAKYIIIEFADLQVLLIHLGMTGTLKLVPATQTPEKHDHLLLDLDDGASLRFHDPRRFGLVTAGILAAPGGLPAALVGLAPEPLTAAFDALYLEEQCRDRRRTIKSLLMDNRCVVGVGNIYASESLFLARIHPRRPAGSLSRPEIAALVAAVKEILRRAIAAGGTTISDFQGVDGSEGRFVRELQVYGRDGEPCPVCRQETIAKMVIAGRSSYFCPACQS